VKLSIIKYKGDFTKFLVVMRLMEVIMSKWKIYTPDGVQDILFNECYAKRELENKIRNTFRSLAITKLKLLQ